MRTPGLKLGLAGLVLSATMAISACDSSDGGGRNNEPPPVTPNETAFNDFVRDQFAVTPDDNDPVAVDDMEFTFNDDPNAFDDLLQ